MPSLPTDPRDADAAITGSRFASLGDAPFYRGLVNAADGDTALICTFVILSAIYGLRPAPITNSILIKNYN